jgi:signal transduction histidine kinase
LSELLLAAHPAILEPVARRNAQLLAAMTLAHMAHAISALCSMRFVVAPDCVALMSVAVSLIAAMYLVAYAFSRSRTPRPGAYLMISVQLLAPVVLPLIVEHLTVVNAGGWAGLAVLSASVLLRPRAALVVGAVAVFALVASFVALGLPVPTIGQSVLFLAGLTAVVYVLARHRDAVETIRQSELRDRNAALEGLRAKLEDRVTERTRELETSRADVETAYHALKDNQSALLQTEKMAAIGRLTAGFAHELASPLAAVVAASSEITELSEELRRSIGDSEVSQADLLEIASEMKEVAALVDLGATRAANFVRGIRAHTRDAGKSDRCRFDVMATVRDSLQLVAHAARAARVSVAFDETTGPAEMIGIPSRLSQAVVNIVGNAIDAVGDHGGGNVRVRVANGVDRIVVEIEDDGPGIRPSVLPRIFDALFTTKPHGKGTGLGLAIVHEIVKSEFKGTVAVTTGSTSGTTFALELPK